jgi:hypothetical protein
MPTPFEREHGKAKEEEDPEDLILTSLPKRNKKAPPTIRNRDYVLDLDDNENLK